MVTTAVKKIAKKLTGGFRANPSIRVQISPVKLNLFQRTDVSNDALGEAYFFTRSFGGEFGDTHQSAARAWNAPKLGYICDFVHGVTLHRQGRFIVVEHEARVVLRRSSTVKQAYTTKIGKTLHAPLFALDLNSGGYAIGPPKPHPGYGNDPGGMFPIRVEFAKVSRGGNTVSKRVTARFDSPKPLAEIDDVVLFSTWLSSLAVKT
jgi:hypothetical protein